VAFDCGDVDELTSYRATLRFGEEFDLAVLAISAAGLPPICRELLADRNNQRFKDMLAHTHTVMTQAFQVWSNRTLEELRWPYPEAVVSSFIEPLDTYCDMTELKERESWDPSDGVRTIGYFCGRLDDAELVSIRNS
jgi:hypothetical protein